MGYNGNTAHIALGNIGLMTDMPPSDIPRGALIKANNISFETGVLTKAPGARKYNSSQVLPAGIVALFDWWPNTTTQRLIAACTDGKIYRDIGDRLFSSATAIATGLGALTPQSKFVEGGNETASADKKLFFFSGGLSQVKVLTADGTSFATITNPAADWTTPKFPTTGCIHRNRLWAFMGQRSYASSTANHETFTANFLTDNIFPGEGGNIIGAKVFKGRLFTFKEGGFVYYLDDSNDDDSLWFWRKLASNFGLASASGIIEISNDMIAVNESGSPISYNAVQALGDIAQADVLKILQINDFFRKSVSLSGIREMHAHYYEEKKQAFFTYRSSARTTNDRILHIDFNRETPRACFWTKDQADCFASRRDIYNIKRPMYGSADGYVYLMDQEDRLTGSTAYTGEFKIAHTDLRFMDEKLAQRNKLFDQLSIEFIPQGSWNVDIDVYIDGTFSETITCLQDVRDDGLGTFTLDTDPLGREESQTITKPLHGSGRRISFHIKQSGSNQNFAIASLAIGFRVSDDKASKA